MNYVSYNLGNSVERTNKGNTCLMKQVTYELKAGIQGTWIFIWNGDNIYGSWIVPQNSGEYPRIVDVSTIFEYSYDQNEIASSNL